MDLMEARRKLLKENNGLPPMYIPCDYLQITGNKARIDTGINGNDETLVFDLDFMTVTRQSYAAAFGNYVDENTKCWRLLNPSGTGDSRMYICTPFTRKAGSSYSTYTVASESSIIGSRINFRISYGRIESKSEGFSNAAPVSDDGTVAVSTRNIAIGAASTFAAEGGTFVGRFWHFKIWRQGKLVRNYIPAIRKSDNKAGFYDLVNHTFNPSIGSVDFIAGYDT